MTKKVTHGLTIGAWLEAEKLIIATDDGRDPASKEFLDRIRAEFAAQRHAGPSNVVRAGQILLADDSPFAAHLKAFMEQER